MKKATIGIVKSTPAAESVVARLQASGIQTNDVSVLMPDKRGTRDFAHEHSTKAPEGAITGVGAGGVIGGTLGLLAGIGALAIPGFGPLIAAGPLMATLSGAAAGAAVGGIAGALVGMGIPEIEAKQYEGKVRGGNILIAVHTESPETRKVVEQILKEAEASDVSTMPEASVPDSSAHRPR
jgi:hypothetical protein